MIPADNQGDFIYGATRIPAKNGSMAVIPHQGIEILTSQDPHLVDVIGPK